MKKRSILPRIASVVNVLTEEKRNATARLHLPASSKELEPEKFHWAKSYRKRCLRLHTLLSKADSKNIFTKRRLCICKYEDMDDPKIKALIDSIRYEPDVCKKMINGK